MLIFADMKQIVRYNSGFMALVALLAVIWVTYTLMYLLTPYFGDDWGYLSVHRTSTGLDGLYPLHEFWLADARHWLHSNGRMANYLASLCLGVFPKWLIDVILGSAACAGAALIVRIGGLWRTDGYGSMAVIIVAVYAMLFPWWDMMFTIDFALNYPFALAVILAATYMFGRMKSADGKAPLMTSAVIIVGVVAGCMHESASLPVLAGVGVWLWFHRDDNGLSTMQRRMLWAFAAGTALATLSPGILFRAAGSEAWRVPDDNPWILVVKSAPITLIVAVAFICSLICSRRMRRMLPRIAASPAIVWGVAAIVALGPVAAGGIVGRSGWFSQAYALIFMCRWIRMSELRLPRAVTVTAAAVAWIVTVAQSIATSVTAVEFGRRMEAIDEAYLESADGVVFADDIDYLTSPWWTLQRIDHRTQDMTMERENIAGYFHREHLPVILPQAAASIDFNTLHTARFNSGAVITTRKPEGDSCLSATVIPFRRAGREFYLIMPRRRAAWGER